MNSFLAVKFTFLLAENDDENDDEIIMNIPDWAQVLKLSETVKKQEKLEIPYQQLFKASRNQAIKLTLKFSLQTTYPKEINVYS